MSQYFQEDDEGSYSCVAENVLGQTSSVAYLSVNSAQVRSSHSSQFSFLKNWILYNEYHMCIILIDKQLSTNISR